jgi:hypothetical protein
LRSALTYPQAELFEDRQRDTVSFTFLDASRSRTGRMYHERRGSGAFGGLLENITQALCRDIFVEAMLRLEAASYKIVAHTHDEYVCEVPEGFGSLEEFLALITAAPGWATELPIAAKARISDRLIEIPEPTGEAAVATDNAIDNAAQDLAERDELTEALCDQDENDEAEPGSTLEPIPACVRELWDDPGLAAQTPWPPSPSRLHLRPCRQCHRHRHAEALEAAMGRQAARPGAGVTTLQRARQRRRLFAMALEPARASARRR